MRLDELASALHLTYQGDGALELTGLCSADQPRPAHLSFALSPRYLQGFMKANCACVVITRQSWLEPATAAVAKAKAKA
nr:hypothetical protein [Pseudomonadota bacterium]